VRIPRRLLCAATAAVAATASVSASSEEYEVIEANSSNYFFVDGEGFENKIIDFSNGNWMTIIANTTNWTTRNVGFRGIHDHGHNAMVVRDDSGNTSTIENVYNGDGCVRPDSYSSHGQCGISVHRGHIAIRNVYVEDWPSNGIYASGAAYDTPGTVTIKNCFGKNIVSCGCRKDFYSRHSKGRLAPDDRHPVPEQFACQHLFLFQAREPSLLPKLYSIAVTPGSARVPLRWSGVVRFR